MKTTNIFVISICMFIAWILFGCGPIQSYPGPRRPRNEVAVLHFSYLQILQIDGKEYNYPMDENNAIGYSIEILPGEHKISWISNSFFPNQDNNGTLNARAGRNYRIYHDSYIGAYIATDGEGLKPSEDWHSLE